jgi:NLR family CARD domain-containing protein 3
MDTTPMEFDEDTDNACQVLIPGMAINVRQLANELEKNTELIHLDLSFSRIGNEDASAGAITLNKGRKSTRIAMICEMIGDSGATALAKPLQQNTSLESRDLRRNKIGHNNLIGNEGALAMAAELKENTVLTHLSLTENRIGVEGAVALASALKLNASLEELELGRNEFGDGGAVAFASALKVMIH